MDNTEEENRPDGENEEEEVEQIDPNTLKPDLFLAASNNDTEKVLQLLDQRVPPTHVDTRTGLTALHYAALNGNVHMVKRLLECGASEPYHSYIAKLQKDQKNKDKRKRRSDLQTIDENAAENDEPVDEMKGEIKEEEEVEGEEEEEEDDFDMGLNALEVSVDYTKNTPLLWAVHRGHLRVIWLLLAAGYSPNDIDKMENNALHLAAAYGEVKNMQVLINSGGNANAVNYYKNKPIDMAKSKAVRDLLAVAMEVGASLTDEERARKHEQNIRQYTKLTESLKEVIEQARNSMEDTSSNSNSLRRTNRQLMDAINMGEECALDQDFILEAERLLKKLEVTQELEVDIENLESHSPIQTQSQYLEQVSKLEKSIEKASEVQVDSAKLQQGIELINRCQIEYWLSVLLDRLKDVITAVDANEHDMNKLRAAIGKAEDLTANNELIEKGKVFLKRLDAELGMSRALKNIPTIRLPMENPPDGYYTEQDVGKVKETENYPLPPPEGDYIWIPAESYTNFVAAINVLKQSYNGADVLGANANIIAESKERLAKAEKELKQLEAKDANDKTAALEAVKKAAKKLKSKKKKEKPAK